MKIDLGKIAGKNGESLGFSFEVDFAALEYSDPELRIVSKIAVDGHVRNELETFIADGVIVFLGEGLCARCLIEFSREYRVEFSEKFAHDSEEEGFVVRNNEVDFSKAVLENILVNIPVKMLCGEDCAGLCMKCGANLNLDRCECGAQKINPQFAKLAALLK